jgi:three-Cys-motif partner protein
MTAQGNLFANLPPPTEKKITFRRSERPLWTENKARLIERYLFYFVLITRHGAYIDGFAGPQRANAQGSWAAKLVLESEPKFLREFWLCELNPKRVAALEAMVKSQASVKGRRIRVVSGDFNQNVESILSQCGIEDATASFCLLDQHTFECEWKTLQRLAQFKRGGYKIELLYFLASGWLDRALKGTTKNIDKIERWWGSDDWRALRSMSTWSRAVLLADRFRKELGYAHAFPWPIYKKGARPRTAHVPYGSRH